MPVKRKAADQKCSAGRSPAGLDAAGTSHSDARLPSESLLRVVAEEVVSCRKCPRLVVYREKVAQEKRCAFRDWTYWGKPIPGFGDPHAKLFILGLAPPRTAAIAPDASSPAIAPPIFFSPRCTEQASPINPPPSSATTACNSPTVTSPPPAAAPRQPTSRFRKKC